MPKRTTARAVGGIRSMILSFSFLFVASIKIMSRLLDWMDSLSESYSNIINVGHLRSLVSHFTTPQFSSETYIAQPCHTQLLSYIINVGHLRSLVSHFTHRSLARRPTFIAQPCHTQLLSYSPAKPILLRYSHAKPIIEIAQPRD